MSTNTISKVDNFISSTSLPESIAKGVLRTVEDCQSFYIDYYGRNRHTIDDLLDYRDDKIANSQITLDNFIGMCYTGSMLETFESTFYQSFTTDDMKMIGDAIADGRTSLEQLFLGFKKNPDKNILKNVL
jgi:hypothetical protein